ncbi:MAG TPA: BREX system P-loop protein BrxC, partial [Anaerolineaceae bacterium]|nr:BREX system P-loop protein BrxC [Anaerolineaceae bacterium]
MKNRELFLINPTTFTIPNDGVTTIYSPQTDKDWEVVRYELRSFVCEGEYHRGLERIPSSFLGNLANPKQSAVWVSGFYGSGKSHLMRVLQYLWNDVELPDKARARSLVNLPTDIQDLLKELSTRGIQAGGLWSAAGKLTAAADQSVRLGLLGIIFQCAGLPEQYHLARFVIWLKQKGYYNAVREWVEKQGDQFNDELDNLYVSQTITDGLLQVYPGFANKPAEARKLLAANFPQKTDISDDEFLDTLEYVLELQQQVTGKLPLTLIIFDELQQFIGEDPGRTLQLQNVVESCSARLGSKLLFIGTGQASLQATPQLAKLVDRFQVKVMLEDSDVETVVRQVVLRKAADKVSYLENVLATNRAEIDRQLVGTQIAPSAADNAILVADYPLLPTRRRFWERVLRAIDTAGTAAQLRTQLRVIHEANREVADRPVGTVVPADMIYEQQESSMLQSGVLLREIATIIHSQEDGTLEGELRKRLCSLAFLIGKLPTEGALISGIKANPETLADLLVEDLPQGSSVLRQQIPGLLEQMTQQGILMKVDDEFRLQTAEGSKWEEDFRKRFNSIRANDVRIASERSMEFRQAVSAALKGIILVQGSSKTARKFELYFGLDAPKGDTNAVPVWIQDEWSVTEKTVSEAAQTAGTDSPIVFVLLPKREADALKDALAAFNAAKEILDTRPNPTTPEGFEARRAMDSRKILERKKLDTLINGIIEKGRVYQGGGYEIVETTFAAAVKTSLGASLARLFPKFGTGDHKDWGKVVEKVQDGAADALTAVGFSGNANQHPVCQEVLNFIGGAVKKGSEIRKKFTGVGYGWPQDAVDGALLVLLACDYLTAAQNGQASTIKQVNQSNIGITDFRLEGITITIAQRITLRGLFTELKVPYTTNEESNAIPAALQLLIDLANEAGGLPPMPERPSTSKLDSLRSLSGNEQFAAVVEAKAELLNDFTSWTLLKEKKTQRLQRWNSVQRLKKHAADLP